MIRPALLRVLLISSFALPGCSSSVDSAGVQDVVRAKRIEIVDDAGMVYFEVGVDEGRQGTLGQVILRSSNGTPSLLLAAHPSGQGSLFLFGKGDDPTGFWWPAPHDEESSEIRLITEQGLIAILGPNKDDQVGELRLYSGREWSLWPQSTTYEFSNAVPWLSYELPSGGRVRGVQSWENEYDRMSHVFVSGESRSGGFLATAVREEDGLEIVHVEMLRMDGKQSAHTGAGAFQMLGQIAAVGVEDAGDGLRSEVQFWDFVDPIAPQRFKHLKITRRADELGSAAADSVGLAEIEGEHVVVVFTRNEQRLDFYRSNALELADERCRFERVATWSLDGADRSGWVPNDLWAEYQCVNLFAVDGELRMLGMYTKDGEPGRDGVERGARNVVDEFSVNLRRAGVDIEKIDSTNFEVRRYARFEDAAGALYEAEDVPYRDDEPDMFEYRRYRTHAVSDIAELLSPGALLSPVVTDGKEPKFDDE